MFLNYWIDDHFTRWVFFVAVWLYRMNEALGLYDPIFIIPLLQAGFIIFAIIVAHLLWRNFRVEPGHWLFFCFGIFFVCVGLPLLSPKDPSSSKPPDIRAGYGRSRASREGRGRSPGAARLGRARGVRTGTAVAVARRVAQGPVVPRRPAVVAASSGSSSGRLSLTGSGHVAAAPVARRRHASVASSSWRSPRAVTAKGSSRRSLDATRGGAWTAGSCSAPRTREKKDRAWLRLQEHARAAGHEARRARRPCAGA